MSTLDGTQLASSTRSGPPSHLSTWTGLGLQAPRINLLFLLAALLILAPPVDAAWGHPAAMCRQACNMAFLSCMSVYGELSLRLDPCENSPSI
jgi:hypothetical protein